jgi:hypothetical protein
MLIKRSIAQEIITIIKIHAPSVAFNFIKLKVLDIIVKTELNNCSLYLTFSIR